MGEEVVIEGGKIRLRNPNVQESVITSTGTFSVYRNEESVLYLVFDVESTIDYDESMFVLRDGDQIVSDPDEDSFRISPVTRECNNLCIAIPVSQNKFSHLEVDYVLTAASWTLGSTTENDFRQTPALHLQSAAIVEGEAGSEFQFQVRNDGSRAGGFRGIVRPDWINDVSAVFGFDIKPGQSKEKSFSFDEFSKYGPSEIELLGEITPEQRVFTVRRT